MASLKDEKGLSFQSRAFYRTDEDGELDLTRASALGGDYVGVHPMGPFWSLKPEKTFLRQQLEQWYSGSGICLIHNQPRCNPWHLI